MKKINKFKYNKTESQNCYLTSLDFSKMKDKFNLDWCKFILNSYYQLSNLCVAKNSYIYINIYIYY